jgi:hypothetical protein
MKTSWIHRVACLALISPGIVPVLSSGLLEVSPSSGMDIAGSNTIPISVSVFGPTGEDPVEKVKVEVRPKGGAAIVAFTDKDGRAQFNLLPLTSEYRFELTGGGIVPMLKRLRISRDSSHLLFCAQFGPRIIVSANRLNGSKHRGYLYRMVNGRWIAVKEGGRLRITTFAEHGALLFEPVSQGLYRVLIVGNMAGPIAQTGIIEVEGPNQDDVRVFASADYKHEETRFEIIGGVSDTPELEIEWVSPNNGKSQPKWRQEGRILIITGIPFTGALAWVRIQGHGVISANFLPSAKKIERIYIQGTKEFDVVVVDAAGNPLSALVNFEMADGGQLTDSIFATSEGGKLEIPSSPGKFIVTINLKRELLSFEIPREKCESSEHGIIIPIPAIPGIKIQCDVLIELVSDEILPNLDLVFMDDQKKLLWKHKVNLGINHPLSLPVDSKVAIIRNTDTDEIMGFFPTSTWSDLAPDGGLIQLVL